MTDYPISPRVLVDGMEIKPDDGGSNSALLTGVPYLDPDTLSFTWGRQQITDQPDQSTASFTIKQQIVSGSGQPTLFQTLHAGSVVQIRSTDTTGRDVLMWAGEITQASIVPTPPSRLTATVSCTDASTILGNITVGDTPWPEETAWQRFQRILSVCGTRLKELQPAGSSGWLWQLTGTMDSTLRQMRVAFRDVDAQPPLSLIQELAATVGGIAWVTADDNGPYIWIERPTRREGLRQFFVDSTSHAVTVGQMDLASANVNQWDADDVVPRDVSWVQDPSQAINVVDVTWQQRAGVNDQGNPAYNTVTVEQRDPASVKGVRALQVDTQLTGQADASLLAYHWLIWTHSSEWLMSDMSIDTGLLNRITDSATLSTRLAQVMDLLDVRARIGYRLTVTDLPAWAPEGAEQSFYIEGGTVSWSSSRWHMDLVATSNAIGGGAIGSDFAGMGLTCSNFGTLRAIDIAGVAGPNGFSGQLRTTDASYTSLEAALADTASGGTLTIQKQWNRSSTFTVNKPVTIAFDYTGKITTPAGVAAITVTANNVSILEPNLAGPGATTAGTSAAISAVGTAAAPIDGLTIDTPTIDGFDKYGIYLENVTNLTITDPQITNVAYAGIMGLSCVGGTVSGGSISKVTMPSGFTNAYGVAFSRDSTKTMTDAPRSANITVDSVSVDGVQWEGLDTHAGQAITFSNCTVTNCKTGIALVAGKGTTGTNTYAPQKCVVTGNTVDGVLTDGTRAIGISLAGAADTLGAPTEAADACVITGNTVLNHGLQGTNTSSAIQVYGTTNVLVARNTVVNAGYCGIQFYHDNANATCDNNTVIDAWTSSLTVVFCYYVRADYNTIRFTNNNILRASKVASHVNDRGLDVASSLTHTTVTDAGGNHWDSASVLATAGPITYA